MIRRPPRSTLFPTRRSSDLGADTIGWHLHHHHDTVLSRATINRILTRAGQVTAEPSKRPKSSYIRFQAEQPDRKSTRLNSSHANISYAVFCLKKKYIHPYYQ